MDEKLGQRKGESEKLITYVKDRAGHDLRYAIDATKLKMNWAGCHPSFEEGISKTIDWYLNNTEWLNHVTSGNYQNYYDQQYHKRKADKIYERNYSSRRIGHKALSNNNGYQ